MVPGVPWGPLHVSLVSALGTPLTTSAGTSAGLLRQAAAPAFSRTGEPESATWNFIFWLGMPRPSDLREACFGRR